ncbi:hypothetical protein ABPG75_012708 [Micractinium tetrahymenae]
MTHSSSGKVREGVLGANKAELSAEVKAALQQRWADYMLPRTGYATYEEMRRGINKERGRPSSPEAHPCKLLEAQHLPQGF